MVFFPSDLKGSMEETGNDAPKRDAFPQLQPSPAQSSVKSRSVKEMIQEFKPILLFMPLIFLISSDEATLIVNQMLFLADFNLGAEFANMGALIGVSQIVRAFTTLSFGCLADKYNRRRLLLGLGLSWAVFELLVAVSPSFLFVFVARVIASALAGAASSVVLSLLSDLFSSENRGNSFAVWEIISMIGIGIGSSLAGIFNVIDYTYPSSAVTWADKIQFLRETYPVEITYWRYPFYLFAGLGLFCTLIE